MLSILFLTPFLLLLVPSEGQTHNRPIFLPGASSPSSSSPSCTRWCPHVHNPREMFCCGSLPNSMHHEGECPQRIVHSSYGRYCYYDGHCYPSEKCCFSKHSQRPMCVQALTNRAAPELHLRSRFGGGNSLNFEDLGFGETYRHGNEGWGRMGDMEYSGN